MKANHLVILSALFFVFIGCKNEKKEAEIVTVETSKDNFNHEGEDIAVTFEDEKLNTVFKEYIAVKNALINTDAAKTSANASTLMTAFANIGVEDVALKAAQNIVESDNVEEQRASFVVVTAEVEKMLNNGTITSGNYFKQYCPMAFNNNGGYWLSESDKIANPYFGDKMYRCGRIDAKIE
jgi:hypothetical protein